MGRFDNLLNAMITACKFCPVCGVELIVVTVKTTIKNSGDENGEFVFEDKSCPDDHAQLMVSASWDPQYGNPQAVFDLHETFFDDKK